MSFQRTLESEVHSCGIDRSTQGQLCEILGYAIGAVETDFDERPLESEIQLSPLGLIQ